MTKNVSPLRLLAIFVVLLCSFRIARSQSLTQEQALTRANSFLQVPETLHYAGIMNGFYFDGELQNITIAQDTGFLNSYFNREPMHKGTKISTAKLDQKATDFATKALNPQIVREMQLIENRFYDNGMEQAVLFRYCEFDGEARLPHGYSIAMDVYAAKVRSFNYYDAEVIKPWPKPLISKEQAIAIARKATSITRVDSLATTSQFLIGKPKQEKRENTIFWEITLKGLALSSDGDTGYNTSWMAIVNAETGKLETYTGRRLNDVVVRLTPATGPRSILFSDKRPYWTGTDQSPIYFSSYRPLKAANGKLARGSVPARIEKNGQMTVLIVPNGYTYYSEITRDEGRLALWMYEEIWILDLKKGELGRLNDSERVDRGQPNWNAQGNLLAATGQGGSIYLAGIAAELGPFAMRDNYQPVMLSEPANFPTLSPDGKWLAFSFARAESSKTSSKDGSKGISSETDNPKNCSIAVVKLEPSAAHAKPTKPIILASGLPTVERLSWFPDSQRFAVSYANSSVGTKREVSRQPDVVNVKTKRISPLNLPILHDPAFRSGYKLVLSEVAVSLSGKKLAFNALVWSGNIKDDASECIFTCNLNGTDLKRLTPTKNTALVPLKFGALGLNALNAWEKLAAKIVAASN